MGFLYALYFALLITKLTGGEGKFEAGHDARIHIAANDAAKLYINGVRKLSVFNNMRTESVVTRLKSGDVVAVKAINIQGWHGVIVDIELNGVHYYTGGEGWRARHAGLRTNEWMMSKNGFCWDAPILSPESNHEKSFDFPYENGAKYVWASTSSPGSRNSALLRIVIGGDECNSSRNSALPADDFSPSRQMPSDLISGASEQDRRTICNCELAAERKGTCYFFLNHNLKAGYCASMPCKRSYHCVENAPTMCIRRYIAEKIVPLPNTNPLQCTTGAPGEFTWVPYESI